MSLGSSLGTSSEAIAHASIGFGAGSARLERAAFTPHATDAQQGDADSNGLKELWLIALAVLWLACVAALASHNLKDAAWSTSGGAAKALSAAAAGPGVSNWLGKGGAWLSDIAYFAFGFGAWWFLAAWARTWLASLAASLRGARSQASAAGRFGWWLALSGLVCAHSVLEWSRLHSFDARLPGRAGGALGDVLGPLALKYLGGNGSALLCVGLLVVCSAVVLRFSWGGLAQRIGQRIDDFFEQRRVQREHAQDFAAGAQAARERSAAASGGSGVFTDRDATGPEPSSALSAASATLTTSGTFGFPAAAATSAATAAPTPSTAERSGRPLDVTPPWDDTMPPAHEPGAYANPPGESSGPALRIEPTLGALAPQRAQLPPQVTAASAPLPPSERVVRERQKGLFADLPDTKLPQVALLDPPPAWQEAVSGETLEMTSRLIEKKLKDFGVSVHVVAAAPGPVITRYEIEPATGVKGSQIVNLAKDLARSLSLVSIRVIETIPGKNIMALELPNAKRQTIRLSEILGSEAYNAAKGALSLGLGKDIVGKPVVVDLAKMPHCLVAGTTGSGKSVGINSMILSILYKAEAKDVRLLLIDPKMLEMSVYEGIPHLIAPVVTDMSKAANGLNWCVNEMERRYRLMSKMGVRNLAGFNVKIDEAKARGESIPNPFSLTPQEPEPLDRLPMLVVVIDELADLMMVVGKKIEELIARLAQKARAAGIHLVLATQRPSVDVITGLIKANVPTRLSFQVSSKIDSRTILDQMGAEALLGMGDMLYLPVGQGLPTRVHGAFVSDDEVHRVVAYLKTQGEPNYIEGVLEGGTVDDDGPDGGGGANGSGEADSLYDKAVDIVLKNNKASISLVQRHLGIGYNKAANLLEAMEKAGLVSAMNGRGARDILAPNRSE